MRYETSNGMLTVEMLNDGVMLKLFDEDSKKQRVLNVEDLIGIVAKEENNFTNKWVATHLKLIEDQESDKEVKLLCILELLYGEHISLRKACELCKTAGLFATNWVEVDYKTTKLWQEYWMKE